MKSSEVQVNHISSTSPSFVLDDSLNVEGNESSSSKASEHGLSSSEVNDAHMYMEGKYMCIF